MDNLFAIYGAYKSQSNIYGEVKNFIRKVWHSPNFVKLMEWLRESIQLQESRVLMKSEPY